MLPDVAPVDLGFDYEPHNAQTYKFNTYAISIELGDANLQENVLTLPTSAAALHQKYARGSDPG